MKPEAVVARLIAHGYTGIIGITFDLFTSDRGIALLAGGREVRFAFPSDGPEEVALVERRRRERD